MGPRPDLRRMLVPLGPVAVFGASNFPLAFSVPGGDTASALAAGCPVVVKAHGSHPATSQLCFDVLDRGRPRRRRAGRHARHRARPAGRRRPGRPPGDPRRRLHRLGRTAAGRCWQIIERRPDPIPFFGELSSLNPVVVTPAAAAERAAQIGAELVGSFTLGAGQFCTKPGPGVRARPAPTATPSSTRMAEAVARRRRRRCCSTQGIAASYGRISDELADLPGVADGRQGARADGAGFRRRRCCSPTTAADLPREVTEECFGPVAVVARYDDEKDAVRRARRPAVVAHRDRAPRARRDRPAAGGLAGSCAPGPAGSSTTPTRPASPSSGPSTTAARGPSTNSQHTSVGATAIRRFLRPVTWQGAPQEVLPEELTDDYRGIPRRIDGKLQLPRD